MTSLRSLYSHLPRSRSIHQAVQFLHRKSPKLAQTLSFLAGTGTMATNSLALALPLYASGLAKTFANSKTGDKVVLGLTEHWLRTNRMIIDTLTADKDWQISLPDDLKPDGKYLLVCNHQSWVDTAVVQYLSLDRLPITRFFAKHELLFIPVVGQAFYFLDFPMMKRHSKDSIAKNADLALRDLDEARRACALLADKPFVLLNYLEGTRFTEQKNRLQKSPYRHLLKPKAGGFALAIASLGDQIDGILDMTVVYPDGVPTYAQLWQGRMTRLGVDIRHLDMDQALFDALQQGKYSSDDTIKAQLYNFLDALWRDKDARIDAMLVNFANQAADVQVQAASDTHTRLFNTHSPSS